MIGLKTYDVEKNVGCCDLPHPFSYDERSDS